MAQSSPQKQQAPAKKIALTVFRYEPAPKAPIGLQVAGEPAKFLYELMRRFPTMHKRFEKDLAGLCAKVAEVFIYDEWHTAVMQLDQNHQAFGLIRTIHNRAPWGAAHSPVLCAEAAPVVVGQLEDISVFTDFLGTLKGAKDVYRNRYSGRRGTTSVLEEFDWGAWDSTTFDLILPGVNVCLYDAYANKKSKVRVWNDNLDLKPLNRKLPFKNALLRYLSDNSIPRSKVVPFLEEAVLDQDELPPNYTWKDRGGQLFLIDLSGDSKESAPTDPEDSVDEVVIEEEVAAVPKTAKIPKNGAHEPVQAATKDWDDDDGPSPAQAPAEAKPAGKDWDDDSAPAAGKDGQSDDHVSGDDEWDDDGSVGGEGAEEPGTGEGAEEPGTDEDAEDEDA